MSDRQDAEHEGHEPDCPCKKCSSETRRRQLGANLRVVAAGLAIVASLWELVRDFLHII